MGWVRMMVTLALVTVEWWGWEVGWWGSVIGWIGGCGRYGMIGRVRMDRRMDGWIWVKVKVTLGMGRSIGWIGGLVGGEVRRMDGDGDGRWWFVRFGGRSWWMDRCVGTEGGEGGDVSVSSGCGRWRGVTVTLVAALVRRWRRRWS